jgi:hypothetical protein
MGFKRDRPLSMENGHESKIMVNMEGMFFISFIFFLLAACGSEN